MNGLANSYLTAAGRVDEALELVRTLALGRKLLVPNTTILAAMDNGEFLAKGRSSTSALELHEDAPAQHRNVLGSKTGLR